MEPYIGPCKDVAKKIVENLETKEYLITPDVQFGFVGYRDHPPYNGETWVTKAQNLTDVSAFCKFVDTMSAKSTKTNDVPEAVLPGLNECLESITWREPINERTVRIVFHIADAPPHGTMYYTGKTDHFPEGDPSGLKSSYLAKEFWKKSISYRLLTIGTKCALMVKDFEEKFKDCYILDLEKPKEMGLMIPEMVNT